MPGRQPVLNRWNRWGLPFAVIGAIALIPPAVTAADPMPEALLAIDPQVLAGPDAGPGLRVILDELAADRRLIDPETLSFLAWPDPGCTAQGDEAVLLIRDVREGLRRYFDDTDLPGAAAAIGRGLGRLARSPCLLAHRDEDRAVVLTAGLLWVRILKQGSAPADARPAAELLSERFSPAEVARADVPPDAKAFVESVRDERAPTRVALRVRFRGAQEGEGTRLLIDGIEVPAAERDGIRVVPGRRAVSAVLPDGRVLSSFVDVGPTGREIAIDLGISGALSRVAAPVPALGAVSAGVLRRLASRSGVTVLFLGQAADGSLRLASISPGTDDGRAAAGLLIPATTQDEDASSVLLAATSPPSRRSWAWPWVTGALSAGLLSAGVALNVLANQDAESVNTGTNRLDDFRARRAGAIACYSLAAASAAATVLLAVLRPDADRTPSVVPVAGGAVVGLGGSF
jgi:hypothetical protein